MSNKLLALFVFSLALAACGSPKKSPDDPSNKSGGGTGGSQDGHLSDGAFQSQCTVKGGFISDDAQACLVYHKKSIPNGQSDPVVIYPSFRDGMFLVSVGTSGAVVITLNGQRIADVNTRALITRGNGVLSYEVLLESEAKASAVVYECYDRNMSYIFCDKNKIP